MALYIFAFCREPTIEDERILCTIRIDEKGVLSITPDFNKSKKPYKVEIGGLGKGLLFLLVSFLSS